MSTITNAPKKRRTKQRWPFIKKRTYPNGTTGWQVDARTKEGGERRTFTTEVEADAFAHQCRIKRENEGVSAFENSDLAAFGKTVADAVAFYLVHLRQAQKSVPLETAINELLTRKKTDGRSTRYTNDLRVRLDRLKKDFPGASVAELDAKRLDEWLAGLDVAPLTRATYRQRVSALMAFCARRGYVATNAAASTETVKYSEKPVEILTVDEAASVLACSTDDVLPYQAIGLLAGLRTAELLKLDWKHVDLPGGFIEVPAAIAKGRKRRLVKIEPNLSAWLTPHAKTAGRIAPAGLRVRLDAARRLAGFGTPTAAEKKAGVKLKPWPDNAARHSFASYWLAKHQNVEKCSYEMGNSAAMVFRHYREIVKPAEAERYWQIMPEKSRKIVQMSAA